MNTRIFVVTTVFLALLSNASLVRAQDTSADMRTPIELDPEAKAFVLAEMRHLLESVQTIMDAALRKDMNSVVSTATPMGMAAMQATPPQIGKQLPMTFRQMGRGVHEAMDVIARDARDFGEPNNTLEQVNAMLKSCVDCHRVFRFK
ncbi:MAG: hypothetical protein OEZ43_12600 [Gammaproteobacteria bacterium]|nr:hypothetical protein [Gammaproteobacteria bacterium]